MSATAAQIEAAHPAPVAIPRRVYALDAARGLAVLLMVVDHLALFAGADAVRLTLGRLAMPLFFVVAGCCFSRLRWRHAGVFLIGVGLPLAVPWVDSPNVLCWYVLGAVLVAGARRLRVNEGWLAVLGLTVAANGWGFAPGTGYEGFALVGLMGLGASVVGMFTWAARLPGPVAAVGRSPLRWYVGHLLVLQTVVEVAAWLSRG